ncbi:MAG TPA: isochorismate synthase [Solirubrobacteraceae bacterium]|nr:isochorismate synthase [Solirubrobacteraceae bacterium]
MAPASRVAAQAVDGTALAATLTRALARARERGEPVLACHTFALPSHADPSAWVHASRRPGEDWFLFEQPARGASAIAGLGRATRIESAGPGRFADAAGRWRGVAAGAVSSGDGGPLAVGGFAFAPDGGQAPHWHGYAPASLDVPELAVVRRGASVRATLAANVGPDDTAAELTERLLRRAEELHAGQLPLLDPAPAGRYRVVGAMPPEHHELAVARATELIAAGRFAKIVLAREVHVHAPADHDPAAVFGVLREEFPSCFVFCVARGASAFVAASPELLLRREGHRVSTVALAASTRRSADPAVDDHLGEQMLRDASYREEHAIVARRIERLLEPHAVWVAAAREPEIVRIANIQHLATPIRAQLATPIDALELAGLLHPTPAVAGEPVADALPLIPALEGLDRGWYLGPVGWTDAVGDGEFCVALRCALLAGPLARCFAGGGIVRGSVPASELAETEIKLQALLPLLSG